MSDNLIENSQRWTAEWAAIAHERDELRAEVERLRSLKAGTVTVALANGLFGSDKYVPEQRARELEAEVERLRAALATIAEWGGSPDREAQLDADDAREAVRIANEALDHHKE